MRRHRPAAPLIAAACLTLALALSGCGPSISVAYEADGGAYDDTALQALLNDHPLGDAADVATADAVDLREEVLIDLRTQGDEAQGLADILTRDFPLETAALPVLAEAGSYGGAEVWIVLEAWGDDDGDLTHARVWVFDRASGALMYSASRR